MTPETERLLRWWRDREVRELPFLLCQMEAVETIIWLTEYAGPVGSLDYRIHAEMTYFTAPNHAVVFRTGSIACGQALPSNGFDNSASRLPANVGNTFLRVSKLPGHRRTVEEKQRR